MDSTKSNVVKSKSSTSKSAVGSNKSKKSWSNAEFQRQALKKRGVYVEKKTTKLDINSQDDGRDSSPPATLQEQPIRDPTTSPRLKPPPRPKRDQKRFLNSVLTILDKDSIATQCPDFKEPKKIKRPSRKRQTPNKNGVAVHTSQQVEAIERKKPKYRSKVLSSGIYNQDEKLYILSSKRDITSTNSERSYVTEPKKYLDLPKAKEERDITKHIYSDVSESIAKEVIEGSKAKKRVIRIEEPTTLVEERQEDRGIYNFFVDLLETTFNVYNVHPDYQSSEQFDTKLEIDETVAEKLQITKERSPDRGQYYFVEEEGIPWKSTLSKNQSRPTSSRMKEARFSSPLKPRKRPQSAPFYHQFKTEFPKTHNAITPKKYKKKPKQDLLSILKEQLMKDISSEEPQDMHQALKMIARNKRRIRQSIRFDETATKSDDSHVCRFKRRNVISASMKTKAKKPILARASPKNETRHPAVRRNLKTEDSTPDESVNYDTESQYSLEVQEFDECFSAKNIPNLENVCHSSAKSEEGYPLLKFTNSLDSSKNYCSAHSDSFEENMDTTSVCMPWDDKKPYCASINYSNMSTF